MKVAALVLALVVSTGCVYGAHPNHDDSEASNLLEHPIRELESGALETDLPQSTGVSPMLESLAASAGTADERDETDEPSVLAECGDPGERCCPGGCNIGAVCRGRTCYDCGDENQPCCIPTVFTPACNLFLTCYYGVCLYI